MAKYRMIIGLITGFLLSYVAVALFSQWESFIEILNYFGSNPLKALYVILWDNFRFDLFSQILGGNFNIFNFFAPQLLAWLLIGFLSGAIVKGVKRGFYISLTVVIVDMLIWILIGIVTGEDLFNLFQDTQLAATLGGIITAISFGVLGGIIGGATSGPYSETL